MTSAVSGARLPVGSGGSNYATDAPREHAISLKKRRDYDRKWSRVFWLQRGVLETFPRDGWGKPWIQCAIVGNKQIGRWKGDGAAALRYLNAEYDV